MNEKISKRTVVATVCGATLFGLLLCFSTTPARAADASCTTKQDKVRLRSGPGQSFNRLAELKLGSPLKPLAYTAKGNTSGDWIRVEVGGTNQKGWVSASPQIVTCNIDVKALPREDANTNTNKDVATEVGQYPGVPRNGFDGDVEGDTVMPGLRKLSDLSQPLVFTNKINLRVIARDRLLDDKRDGAGIKQVSFEIWTLRPDDSCDGSGFEKVYARVEQNRAYCLFGTDAPTCSALDLKKTTTWPDQNNTPIVNGRYKVSAQIDLKDEDKSGAFWFTCFEIQGLPR